MTLRQKILAGVCAAAVLLGVVGDAKADIPVIDVAALGEWATALADDAKAYALQLDQYATEVKTYIGDELSWLKQAQQYATQLQQYANELQLFISFVHNPTLGGALGLLNAAGLGSTLPINPAAMMGLVNGLRYGQGGLPEIAGILNSLSGLTGNAWTTNHVYTPTDGSWASQQVIARANGIAGAQAAAQTAYADLQSHMAALQSLRDQLLAATTPKDVQDLQAEIELETTWTNNEAAQLQAVATVYHGQTDAITQRDNERLAMDLETFLANSPAGGVTPANLPLPPIPPN
jgi:hypothetical protein